MKKILVTQTSMPPYEEYINEIKDIWESHWLTNMGPKHNLLESKLKEYLCQSYTKESEKSILFVDKEDKKRTIPHLMQFNIDEIESVFYISSMVVDTPYILLNKLGSARHIKRYGNFYSRVLVNFDKQIFNGPPETNKEIDIDEIIKRLENDAHAVSIQVLNHH